MKDECEARKIGLYLEEHPPRGFQDRFSAEGWATIAQAVLDAQVSPDVRRTPSWRHPAESSHDSRERSSREAT